MRIYRTIGIQIIFNARCTIGVNGEFQTVPGVCERTVFYLSGFVKQRLCFNGHL